MSDEKGTVIEVISPEAKKAILIANIIKEIYSMIQDDIREVVKDTKYTKVDDWAVNLLESLLGLR